MNKQLVILFIIGVCSAVFTYGIFYLGGYYSCEYKGSGTLINGACVDLEYLGQCEINGNYYTPTEKEGFYVNLDDIYIKNDSGALVKNG